MNLLRLICLLVLVSVASAQPQIGTGIISGQVLIDGKPAANAQVFLSRNEQVRPDQATPPPRTTTDTSGQYRFSSLASGRYFVNVLAPGYLNRNRRSEWEESNTITLADGETIENLDFALVKAGVITGRVSDEQGRPVINESLVLLRLGEDGKKERAFCRRTTDDRGVYRCYDLLPGKYLVGAGKYDQSKEDYDPYAGARSSYTRSWYPNTNEEEKAHLLEVQPGGELTGIDLRLSRRKKGVTVSGRVLAADTNRPLSRAQVGYSKINAEGNAAGFSASADSQTNAEGEFRVLNLPPGKYKLTPMMREGGEYYGESLTVEVGTEDLSGLELQMERGSLVSGVAVLEDPNNRDVARKLASVILMIYPKGEAAWFGPPGSSTLQDDGSFQMKGVAPGQRVLQLGMSGPEAKGFSIVRIEQDGRPVTDGIEVKAGEALTGLRVTLGYGSGLIRGEVKLEGGSLPDGVGLHLLLGRNGTANSSRWIEVDARRRFAIEGLASGTYELTVETHATRPPWDKPTLKLTDSKQTVEVTNGQEAKTTITVNLSGKGGRQ